MRFSRFAQVYNVQWASVHSTVREYSVQCPVGKCTQYSARVQYMYNKKMVEPESPASLDLEIREEQFSWNLEKIKLFLTET